MSFQAIMLAARELIYRIGPTMGLCAVLLLTWVVSRFVAKYQEQQRILHHLPEVIREELQRRDAELKALRAHVAEMEIQRVRRVTALKAAYAMAGRVQEAVMSIAEPVAPTNGRKRLGSPSE